MKFDPDLLRDQLRIAAGCPVNVQQVSALRQRSMCGWPAPMLWEYEERAAIFEYLGNRKRIHANNDAFDHVNALLRTWSEPTLWTVCERVQRQVLRLFAMLPTA